MKRVIAITILTLLTLALCGCTKAEASNHRLRTLDTGLMYEIYVDNLTPEKTGRNRGEGGIKKLNQPSVVPGRPIGRKIFRFLRSSENERQWGAQKQQNYK